jgi:UDP-3-O-[3-hydroxymyristoyl] glucosamine N-acyltransferase
MKLAELAHLARAELAGSGEIEIEAATDLEHAHPAAIVLVADLRRLAEADASAAGALLISSQAPHVRKPALRATNLRAAFARTLAALTPPARVTPGIDPSAVVASGARIGAGVWIGPQAVIGPGVHVGERSALHAGVVVGEGTRIGADCIFYPHVTVYPGCVIGDRVILHAGAVIGSDGFGYAFDQGTHLKIPHLGRVVIEDDVEIGANTTVDRATLGETRIGRGTKIDNLVQIGHNVRIGPGAIVVAQVGIAGSATIGEGALVGGQAGVRDHVTIGAGARIVARAGVTKDVPPGATVSGFPARDHREVLQREAAGARLPELVERLRAIEARLDALDGRRRA